MNPFEDLIRELSDAMEIQLQPDKHQACVLYFQSEDLSIQIDLDTNGDRILVGTQLGRITPGAYRVRVFTQALLVNGIARRPRGILAFSEKNDTLVLYQFLDLAGLNGKNLHAFINLFHEHASIWKEALKAGGLPTVQESAQAGGSGMFGLRP